MTTRARALTLILRAAVVLLHLTTLVALVLPRWPDGVVLVVACVVGVRSLRVVTRVVSGRAARRGR